MYNLDERVRRYRANDFRPEGDLAKKDTYDESYFADNVVVDSGTDENGNKVQTAILNSPTWNEALKPQQTGSTFSNLADAVSNAWNNINSEDFPKNAMASVMGELYFENNSPTDFVKNAIHESQYGTAIEHSKLYESYFRNRDDKNAEIARIANTLKISEDTFAHDQALYQKAAEAADMVEKLKENKQFIDAEGKVDMNKVYASVPGLLDVQQKYGSSAAALALANMDGLKSINDVYTNAAQQFLGSVWAGFERGVYTLGKNMRYTKAALFAEDLSDEDKKAVASYNKSLAAIPKYSFDTAAGAVGGMIGLAAENIVGFAPAQVAAGGASLAVGAGVAKLTNSPKVGMMAARVTRNVIGTLGIAAPILGQEYEEDTAKVDEYGRRVYTNEQARGMDIVKALFQGALEQWTLSDIGNAILGRKKAVSKAVADVIAKSETEEAAKEGVRVVVLDRLKEMAAAGGKSFMSESREEFLQQASDMIVENAFQAGIYGKDADLSSVGDILTQSTAAMIDAAPAILGFGIIGGAGNVTANTRGMMSLRERAGAYLNNRIYRSSVDSTHLADTIIGVQANMDSIKGLKNKAPEAATEILDKQNALMGIEETAVDVKSLAQSDAGLVQDIAKKAGITESELAVAMADESSGKIIVKTSTLMQMDMSVDQKKALHDNVSKTADAFTLKEINEKREDAQKAMKELAKKAEDDYANVDKFVRERFEGADDETVDLARNIIFESNGNPAKTYSERMRNTQQRIDALLSDAKDYLKSGMGQGIDIIATDEDGTPLADQRAVAGGYTRVSNNAEWYRNYFAENGKAPSAREIEDIAIAMVTGESNPYVPEEMRPQSEEMERSMKNSPEATELRELLKTREKLGKLGDTMKAIKPGEVELVSDLTDDGRKVYSVVMRELMQGNREVKKEALVGAILTARLAERIIDFHREAGDTAYNADDFLASRELHANAVLANGDALMQAEKNPVDNGQGKADNEDEIANAVFDRYMTEGIKNIIEGKVSQEIGEHVNFDEMNDPVKRDEARDSLPYIRHMLTNYNTNYIQKNEAYKNRLACKIEYARGCFENDERVNEHGTVRPLDGHGGQGGVRQTGDAAVSRSNGRGNEKAGRRGTSGVLPSVNGEKDDAHKHFLKLYNEEAEKHSENIQGAFSFVKKLFQTAWHGSAHDFDSFDLGKIGSGAGIQVHGWGLYFAKDRKISEDYKERLAAEQIENGGESKARLYEAEIPEDDVMLDENKSFDEQPPKVKKALKKLIKSLDMDNLWFDPSRLSDSEIAEKVLETFREGDGQSIYGAIVDNLDGAKEASLALNKAGIKGIAYDEQGGRCYVVFDDKAVDIINKYNQAANQDSTQTIRGQYGMGELGQHVIDLFSAADESTFMHETAHMYYAMLEELAAAYPSSSAAKELATVKEWAEWREGQAAEYKGTRSAVEFQTREDAIKDAIKHGDTVREKALRYEWEQERFARGFEMYLESGEAPAVGLKRVFRSLKKWLTRVYRDVIGAGAMPSSEVRAVMDRMIASDEEIKMMDALRSAEELERLDPDILETDVAKLHEKWKDEALAEAEERMMARLMKDLKKKREDDEGRRRKEIESKVADDMHQLPCFIGEELVSETGEPESVLTLGYDSVEAWEADLEKNGGSYMAEFDRRFNEAWSKVKDEFPTDDELQDRAVEAMAGQYDKVNALEETILQRRIASYNRATGRTGALVREIESEFRAIKKSADNGGFWKLVESKGKVSVTPDSMKAETTALARRKAIDDFMSKHPDGATIKTEIGDTIMNRSSVKASFGHGIYQAKLDALASVPEGLANSIYLGALDDFDGKDIKNHYFIYPIQYGEEKEPRLVFCRVREIDGKRYVYIHDVFSKDSINRAINAENKISEPLQTRYPSKGDFGRFALFKRIIAQYATKHNGGSKIEKLESLITRLKYAKNWTQDERRLVDDIENAIRLEKAKDAGERKYDRAMDAFAKFKAKTVQNQEWVRAMRDEAIGKTKAMREQALATLSALPVGESSKYSMYHAKEMKAAQKAAEALARATKLNLIQSKDRSEDAQKAMDEAMKRRHEQSMYAAMVGASVKIARKLSVIERRIERERAAVVKNKKLTADYRYYFDRLLYAYGFSTYMPKRPDALIDEHGAPIMFSDWYRAESGDDKASIPAVLVSAMDGGEDVMHYKKLSINDVMDIDLMARLLYETGRHSNELISEGVEGKSLDEIETECLDDYHGNVAYEVSQNKIGKIKGALGPYLTTIIKPETVLRLMGGKMGGYIKYIYNVLFDANEKEQQMREAEAVEYQEIIGRHYTKDELIHFGNKLNGAEARPKSSSEPLTKENVIAMALNWGNTQNRARLCVGFEMTEAEVEDIFHEYMTRNDWEFVQDVWDHLESYGDLVSNVMEKERGVPMSRVKAEPFKMRVGKDVTDVVEMRGGYYPIAADPEKNANVDEMQELDMNRASGGAMAFGVGLSSTKNRSASNKIARPILLTLDVINRHVNQQIHIASMRLACRDAYKVLNNKGIAKSIQDTWGNETYKMLKHWVENVWQPPTSNSKIEHVAGWLRSKTVQAIMAYRVSTALLNASNIAPMVERLGASGTINALLTFVRHPSKVRRFVLNDSVFMRNRANNMDRDLRRVQENAFHPGNIAERAAKALDKYANTLIEETDMMTSVPTYYYVYQETYNRAIDDGVSEVDAQRAAHREAHEAVRSIVGSADTIDQSAVQRDKSEFVRMLTPFYTFSNTMLNAVLEKYYAGKLGGRRVMNDDGSVTTLRESAARRYSGFVKSVLLRFVLMSLIETAIREGMAAASSGAGGGDDKEKWWLKWLKNGVSSATGGFYGLNAIADLTMTAVEGKASYGRTSGGVISGTVDRTYRAVTSVFKLFDQKSRTDIIDAGRDASKAAGAFYGISDTLLDALWNTARFATDNYRFNNPDDLREYIAKSIFDKKLKKKGEK